MKLSSKSQLLTTFNTHFGRYCFQLLPFGLSVSQDLFQEFMKKITDQCTGCVGMSDIIIHGENEETHDRNLRHFFKTAKSEGLACYQCFKVYRQIKASHILCKIIYG